MTHGTNGNPALVTFAIPLRRPNSAAHRKRLDEVLSLTLRSIFRQTHGDFRVLIAAAHRPSLPSFVDDRAEILPFAGFHATSWDDGNREGGARRGALARRFAERGGGYLMFVDHDDFVSRRLVEHIGADRNPHGYAVRNGLIYDAAENIIAPYPIEGFVRDAFHTFCGTSVVLHLTPAEVLESATGSESHFDLVYKNGHYEAFDRMRQAGWPLGDFPFPAAMYTRNTGDNLSIHITGGEGVRSWFRALDAAVAANKFVDDRALRDEFAIPERYPSVTPLVPIFAAPAPPRVSLSVLVCTHRRPKGLRRLLAALTPQLGDMSAREAIVVNDGTHDDAYAEVAAQFASRIRYRALKSNVGIAAARNTAARMATGDYLVFTDDDCEPPPFWLDWIAARLALHPELDFVAGTTRPLWPERPGFFAWVRAVHELIPATARTDGTIIFPAAIVAVRRSLFESMGGFGFAGFHGAGEDTEFATRLSLRGASGVYDPSWFTRHEIADGFLSVCRRYRRYGYANGRLICLNTSPVAHDYMQNHWKAGWLTVWRWEIADRLKAARAAHPNRAVALASATLACVVKMAYWRGVKDAFTFEKAPRRS